MEGIAGMNDLTKQAGVAIKMSDLRFEFGEPVTPNRLSVRRRGDLAAVWCDPDCMEAADGELYAVYWGATRLTDGPAFQTLGLDHAYVMIKPGLCGTEFYKTQGHYHPPLAGTALGQPELYHVLTGSGLFVLQRALPPDWYVDDLIVAQVEPGSVVIVPPNYGHLTINWGQEPLVFEAFLAAGLETETAPYREKRGGACYCLTGEPGPRVVPNERYERLPPVRWERPWQWPTGRSFYGAVVSELVDFTWLRTPAQFDLAGVQAHLLRVAAIAEREQ
jgi:glucose-6-phosphate isomerase